MRKNQKFIAIFVALLLMIFQPLTIFAEEVAEPAETEIVETGFEETAAEADSFGTDDADEMTEEEKLGESVFPGLDAEVFSSIEDIEENKEELNEHLSDVEEAIPGEDFVEDQIIVEAPDEETALLYAEAFGGELLHYEYGFALIGLDVDALANDFDEAESIDGSIVKEAVFASADPDVMLPAAWPNYRGEYADEEPVEYIAEEESQETLDPSYSRLYNDSYLNSSNTYYQWQHYLLQTEAAWRTGARGQNVKVAVLDSGAQYDHVDLTLTKQAYYNGSSLTEGNQEDTNGHGTHCTGIIGAKKNNNGDGGTAIGVAPDAKMHVIKISGSTGSPEESATTQAINKAVNEWKVSVISISLSFKYYPVSMVAAVENAYQKGVAVFVASGNDSSNILSYPSACEHAISVGAVDKNNARIYFSNQTAKVRYSGPGVEIVSTCIAGNGYDITPDAAATKHYALMSGTSQATPAIAGVAALILSSNKKPTGTGPAKVEALLKLMDSCCVSSGVGKGTPNLGKLFGTSTMTTAPAIPASKLKSGIYTDASLNPEVSAESETTIYYTTDGSNITCKNGVISDNALSLGSNSGNITIDGAGKITLRMVARSNITGMCSKGATYTYQLQPKVSSLTLKAPNDVKSVKKGGSIQMETVITPAYAKNKKLNWEIEGNLPGITVNAGGKVSVAKTATANSFTVKATTADGSSISKKLTIHVDQTEPVASIKAVSGAVTLYNGQTLTTEIMTKLKNGTPVRTSDNVAWVSSDTTVATVAITENNLKVAAVAAGKAVITGVAKDGSGKKCTINVTVQQKITSITISAGAQLAIGKSMKPVVTILPQNAANKKLTWEWITASHDGLTLNASTGAVSATARAKTGTYKIRAKAQDPSGKTATLTFEVINDPIKGITLSKTSMRIFRKTNSGKAKTKDTCKVTLSGGNAANLSVTNSDPKLVTASLSGTTVTVQVTGNATGTATVTVASTDGSNIKKSLKVTVVNPITKLYLSAPAGRTNVLQYGKTLQLTPTFVTEYGAIDAAAKKLEWSTSNTALSVSKSGQVHANLIFGSPYTITITAKTTDGSNLSATYTMKANAKVFKMSTDSMFNGYYLSIYEDICPYGAGYTSYGFSITGPKDGMWGELKYDSPGPRLVLAAFKPGTYKVTVYRTDGGGQRFTKTLRFK
ncbi:MAG: S8 family serine peptidase [Lachnospiraceae bacterium]|nr:S8 family serine peptidase [Lachnospiraceae bacterium]